MQNIMLDLPVYQQHSPAYRSINANTPEWDNDHGIYNDEYTMQATDLNFAEQQIEEIKRVNVVLHEECLKQSKLILRLYSAIQRETERRKRLEFEMKYGGVHECLKN
jgi:hypothetical protein